MQSHHPPCHPFPTRRSSDLLREHNVGQVIRAEGPSSHHGKRGTPTMGGLIIILATVEPRPQQRRHDGREDEDRKSTRLNSSHTVISYAVFCLKKKKKKNIEQ